MYNKGSLSNIDLDGDGQPDAFQFMFKNSYHMICFYTTYRLRLFLNEEEIKNEDIIIIVDGKNYPAKDLVKSHLVSHEGDKITIRVRRQGGLEINKEYSIKLWQITSGFFTTKASKIPLVNASDVIKENRKIRKNQGVLSEKKAKN